MSLSEDMGVHPGAIYPIWLTYHKSIAAGKNPREALNEIQNKKDFPTRAVLDYFTAIGLKEFDEKVLK